MVGAAANVLGGLVGAGASAAASLAVLAGSVGIISYIILAVSKFLLWVAAVTFNWSISVLVFGFADILGNSTGMLLAWSLLRDLGNILLIFGFVSIGLQMILNTGHTSGAKTLPRLIIFAVLINFSLFAAEAVVDTTNGLTYSLYNQSLSDSCEGTQEECQLENGVAGQILDQLNIISVVANVQTLNLSDDIGEYFSNPVGSTANYIMLSILVITASVVLFAGAFLFISRGVTLAFLLVTSPIGFAGMAIPALNKMSQKWWDALISNAIFAPAFLILLFVALLLTDGLRELVKVEGGLSTALGDGGALTAGPLFLFVLVIGFLIAALTIAKRFSIAGADFAIQTATRIGTSPLIIPRDRLAQRTEKAAKAYDRVAGRVRSIPLVGGSIDDSIKGGLGMGKSVSVPGWGTYSDWEKKDKARKDHIEHAEHEEHTEHVFQDGLKRAKTDIGPLKRALGEMSLAEIKDTKQLKEGAEGVADVARALTPSQFKDIMKDPKIKSEVKTTLKKERFKGVPTLVASAASGDAKAAEEVQKLAPTDIEMSGMLDNPTKRAELMRTATDSQYDGLIKSDIDDSVKRSLTALREGTGTDARFDPTLRTLPNGAISYADQALKKLGPAKIAQLPSSVLTDQRIVPLLKPNALAAIMRADNLSDPAQSKLVAEIAKIKASGPGDPIYDDIERYLAGQSPNTRRNFTSYYSW